MRRNSHLIDLLRPSALSRALTFVGVLSVLGVIVFVPPSGMPPGEMAYQQLWLGRMTAVFVVCVVSAFCLNRKTNFFCASMVWALILLGGIEAVWGLRQIYGLAVSHHTLYALTGSFYNPGPYSGYLAMVFPVCLHEWLSQRETKRGRYYLSAGVLLLILCVLPAGMSRSAWVAAAVSGGWVYGMHAAWGNRLKEWVRKHGKKAIGAIAVACLVLALAGYALFQLKAASANGRLLMWKISCLAIAEKPFSGHGTASFAAAYGKAQEKYFSQGHYSETEERVAGSPEYAFNEYLQVAVEHGIPCLVVVLAVVACCLWRGIAERRIGVCGGVISVLVFSFSSYPMQIPAFSMAFAFLLVACAVGQSGKWGLVAALLLALPGVYCWQYNRYEACREWQRGKMLYNIGAYRSAVKTYEKLYPALKERGAFLFEYGHCLHKLKEYAHSTQVLEEAERHSCDPMILNIIGKNYQETGRYAQAERYLLRSTHRLPGRIYPYYLLTKLYAQPDFCQPAKMKQAAAVVLTKEPKVQSEAVREMKEEVNRILADRHGLPGKINK